MPARGAGNYRTQCITKNLITLKLCQWCKLLFAFTSLTTFSYHRDDITHTKSRESTTTNMQQKRTTRKINTHTQMSACSQHKQLSVELKPKEYIALKTKYT